MARDVRAALSHKNIPSHLHDSHSFTVSCMMNSRAQSTMLRYDSHWSRFRSWCLSAKFSYLPAEPFHVAMFLSSVLRDAFRLKLTYAPVKAASAAIFAAHDLAGFSAVTDHPSVNAVRSCAQRYLESSGGANRKDPLSLGLCLATASALTQPTSQSLLNLQVAAFIMVCFTGFLRYDDACNIFADEIRFYDSHMEIFISKRKNDQFRKGSVICVAKGSSHSCPVFLLQSLISRAGASSRHVPVFCSFVRGSCSTYRSPLKAWPYAEARGHVLTSLSATAGMSLSQFSKRYGLHSLRSGGATFVAKEGVPDHIFQAHGAWRTTTAMHAYIDRSLDNKLLPTTTMHY